MGATARHSKPTHGQARAAAAPPRAKRASTLRSKVTARAQTTLPSGVRRALGLEAGDEIEYRIQGQRVIIEKAEAEAEPDPVFIGFLNFLARDMEMHPERLRSLPRDLAARARELTASIPIDHDAPIEGEVGL